MSTFAKGNPFSLFFGDPFFWDPFFSVFFGFFLALQRLARLKCNLEPNCGAYLGVIILQPHACTQRFRLRILRRTRSNAGRTSAGSLSGRIESIWETPSEERGVGGGGRCQPCGRSDGPAASCAASRGCAAPGRASAPAPHQVP